MRDDTKLARIRQAMRDESWDDALKLAARFQRLGEHAEAIQRAAKAINSPHIYEELGYDHTRIKEEGIAALKNRYNKSWEEVHDPQSASGE